MGKRTFKTTWICPNCKSDNVQYKAWINANGGDETPNDAPFEDEDCYCSDCEEHLKLITLDIPARSKVIGFQVVNDQQDIHPLMAGSFCLYNLSQAREMLEDRPGKNLFNEWHLLAIWKGDVEEPTLMFKGDPRK